MEHLLIWTKARVQQCNAVFNAIGPASKLSGPWLTEPVTNVGYKQPIIDRVRFTVSHIADRCFVDALHLCCWPHLHLHFGRPPQVHLHLQRLQ